MSTGVGFEQFACPQCRSSLYDPWSRCVDCGYSGSPVGSNSDHESESVPVYSGGDQVLKMRLRNEERARAQRTTRLSPQEVRRLPTQEEVIRLALSRGGGRSSAKRGKSKPPSSNKDNRRPAPQKVSLAPTRNRLMAPISQADRLLWKLPTVWPYAFEEWLPLARQTVTSFALQADGDRVSGELEGRKLEVDRYLYQVYCQLRRKKKHQNLARLLSLMRSILGEVQKSCSTIRSPT